MTISSLIQLVGLLGAGMLAACSSQTALVSPQETTKYSIESSGKFARMDAATQVSIICTGLQERINQEGRLEVVANIKNRTSREIHVRVRCIFKDRDGFATGDETAWQLFSVGDDATEAADFTARTAHAKKYTIMVQSP